MVLCVFLDVILFKNSKAQKKTEEKSIKNAHKRKEASRTKIRFYDSIRAKVITVIQKRTNSRAFFPSFFSHLYSMPNLSVTANLCASKPSTSAIFAT